MKAEVPLAYERPHAALGSSLGAPIHGLCNLGQVDSPL